MSRFEDDAITNAQAILATFTSERSEIEALTRVTLDLAEAKGIDLAQAAQAVSRTVGTERNALKAYGVVVEGTAGSAERLASVQKGLSEQYGGASQAAVNSYAGATDRLSNSFGNLLEEMGKTVTESQPLNSFFGRLATLVDAAAGSFKREEIKMSEVADTAKKLGISVDEATSKYFKHRKVVEDTAATHEKAVISVGKLNAAFVKLASAEAQAVGASEILAQSIGEISAAEIEAEILKMGTAIDSLRLSGQDTFPANARLIELNTARMEELRAQIERLARGLPAIAPAAEQAFAPATASVEGLTNELVDATSGTASLRAGLQRIGDQAQVTALQVGRVNTALSSFSTLGGVFRQTGLSNAGGTADNPRTVSFSTLGGSFRDTSSPRPSGQSGGTFAAIRRAPSLRSDGRILF